MHWGLSGLLRHLCFLQPALVAVNFDALPIVRCKARRRPLAPAKQALSISGPSTVVLQTANVRSTVSAGAAGEEHHSREHKAVSISGQSTVAPRLPAAKDRSLTSMVSSRTRLDNKFSIASFIGSPPSCRACLRAKDRSLTSMLRVSHLERYLAAPELIRHPNELRDCAFLSKS